MSYGNLSIVAQSSEFILYSHGNGDAYHLVEIEHDEEPGVFVQGDDATQFREEFESYDDVHVALREMWNLYTY